MTPPDDATRAEPCSLDCSHCGGDAYTSESGLFGDGDGDKCAFCGFPGSVSVDDSDLDDVTAYWRCSDAPDASCTDENCEECHAP